MAYDIAMAKDKVFSVVRDMISIAFFRVTRVLYRKMYVEWID